MSLAAGEGTSAGPGWLALPAALVLFVVPALLLAGWLLLTILWTVIIGYIVAVINVIARNATRSPDGA